MYSLENMLYNVYLSDKYTFNMHKKNILALYPHDNLSEIFRMTIREIKNLRKYSQISGLVLSGTIAAGETIRILPDGTAATVLDCSGAQPAPGESLTLNIEHISKLNLTGMVSLAKSPQQTASLFRVKIYWISTSAPIAGRRYAFMFGRQRTYGTINKIKNFNETTKHYTCNILLEDCVAFDPVSENPATGTFIIDSEDKSTLCGIGVIEYALRRGANIHQQFIDISKEARASIKLQKPCVLWLTGLSGAGKSSIANAVEKELYQKGYHTYLLDGDNIRHGLNSDLGFSEEDRVENIRRIAEVAHLMTDAGLIVITAFISPFRSDRAMARRLFAEGEFIEVYIDTPLSVAEGRDPKGLYIKARHGELKNFTGINSPYEAPEHPEIWIDTTQESIQTAAAKIIAELNTRGFITLQ